MHAEPLPGCEHMVEVAVSRLMQCADYTSQRLRAGQSLFVLARDIAVCTYRGHEWFNGYLSFSFCLMLRLMVKTQAGSWRDCRGRRCFCVLSHRTWVFCRINPPMHACVHWRAPSPAESVLRISSKHCGLQSAAHIMRWGEINTVMGQR